MYKKNIKTSFITIISILVSIALLFILYLHYPSYMGRSKFEMRKNLDFPDSVINGVINQKDLWQRDISLIGLFEIRENLTITYDENGIVREQKKKI